jgi:thiosulfate/3-mercaptopyruvate sulfurtransferase
VIRPGLLLGIDDLDGLDAVVVDTRLALTGATGRDRYDAGHIPGAPYLDVDEDLADPPGVGGRHPLPDSDRFVAAVRRAGISRGSRVVAYDDGPGTAAARLWWLLRDYGHDDVLVLDGGLAAWTASGRPVSTAPVHPPPGDWDGRPGRLPVVDADDVPGLARHGVLIDVRAAPRFRGEHEPIDPVAGHIPGAVNAPLGENTDDVGRFLADAELRKRFESLGVRDAVPVAAYCGSGVTATQTLLALRLAGFDDAALYPGSWSGWITDPSRPVALSGEGPAPEHGPGASAGTGPARASSDYPRPVSVHRANISVKAMLIAPNDDMTAHAVTLNPPTAENPLGYHRLIGGSVEVGETHHDAIVREVDEELGAAIRDLAFLAAVESIFRINGETGHEIVFLYSGRLDPVPDVTGALVTETDGSTAPVVWRPFDDTDEPLPVYPDAALPWIRRLPDR